MYHREHGGPHFHAVYGEFWISVAVKSGAVRGNFPVMEARYVGGAFLHDAVRVPT